MLNTISLHSKIIIIIFITSIILLALTLGLKEHFQVGYLYIQNKKPATPLGKIFNLDGMLNEQPHNLGWKKFWRENYNKTQVNLENSFETSPYNNFSQHNKLLYDGVRNIDCL